MYKIDEAVLYLHPGLTPRCPKCAHEAGVAKGGGGGGVGEGVGAMRVPCVAWRGECFFGGGPTQKIKRRTIDKGTKTETETEERERGKSDAREKCPAS